MNTNITRLGLAGLLVLGLAVPAAPAVATTAAQGVPVRFGDLNVESSTGARVLYSRIRSAASTVCDSVQGTGAERSARFTACYRAVIDNAVADVNRPQLYAVHSVHTGAPKQDEPRG